MKKEPTTKVPVSTGKTPNCTVKTTDFYQRHPAWRFARSKKFASFGWASLQENLSYVVEKLHDLEGQTWADILNDKKKHHSISVKDLIPDAQRMLEANHEDVDEVFSVHISAQERIFGIIESGVGILNIIWWDPEHKICPSHKKHT